MNREEDIEPVDTFDVWVIAYHDSLGTGPESTTRPKPPTESGQRWWETQDCLELLERVWPRSRSADSSSTILPERVGRFRILRQLGHGGFGIVFLAEDPTLGRLVALKVPRAEALVDPDLRRRFVWEAETAAELSHPNIVPVLEAGEEEAILYIASEYCPGITLAEWLKQHGRPVLPRSAAALVAKLAEVVQYIHSKGILHRDLKPSNLLLTNPPPAAAAGDTMAPDLAHLVPRVTDFGLAKVLERDGGETWTGAALGTARYMAPEQVLGRRSDITFRTDVYGLGAILYELLTGQPPFHSETDAETRQQVLAQEPVPPTRLCKQVPRDLETICLKCLRKEPERRYPTALALAEDLRRFLEGRPIRARRVGWPERLWKWTRRRPAAAVLAAMVPLILAGLLFGGWRMMEQDHRLRAEREIAAAHQYHHLVSKTAESISNPQVGWTFQGLKDIEEAAQLTTTARDVVQLRTLATRCLAGGDLREVAVLAKGMQAFCCVFSPDGKQLAIAQEHGRLTNSVQVYDVGQRTLLRELTFPAAAVEIRQTGVRSLVYSADGRWLAAGVRNGDVHVWDVKYDFEHRHLRSAHRDVVTGLAFRPDGRVLVSASKDKTLKVWDCSTWSEQTCHVFDDGLTSAHFSPDGKYVIWGCIHGFRMTEASRLQVPLDPSHVKTASNVFHAKLGFAPCGYFWFVTRQGRPGITHYPMDAEHFYPLAPGADLDHDREVSHIEADADGALLVTSSHDRTVKLSEVSSGRLLASLAVGGRGNLHAALSRDGRRLAVTGDKETILYEVTGQQEETVVGYDPYAVQRMAFAPDGQRLAYLTRQGKLVASRVSVWSLADSSPRWSYWISAPFSPETGLRTPVVAFHPDGTLLASAPEYEKDVLVWDGCERRQRLPEPAWLANYFCFSRDGQTLWGATYQTNEVISLKWPELTVRSRWSNTEAGNRGLICLSVGERWVLAGSRDLGTKMLRVSDGQLERFWPSPSGPVHSVTLSPDETLAASGTQTGHVQVVRLPDGETLQEWRPHRDAVEAVAFHPGGRLLATGSKDRTVRLCQRDGDQFHVLLALHFGNTVRQVSFSPDGTRLAVLVQNEKAVRVWHLDRLRERLVSMGLGWP